MNTKDLAVKTLLILGASGDLTGRLLLPGVARLIAAGRAPGLSVVGAGSDDWADGQWAKRVHDVFAEAKQSSNAAGAKRLDAVENRTEYHQVDVVKPGALAQLLSELKAPVAVYFALPPAVAKKACDGLTPDDLPTDTRLVLEKPFGFDAASARELNSTLAALVPESHIHRVDHFLGKSTVMNLISLRFANTFLEPIWNRDHVEKIEVVFDEELTLENRARYYDTAGALRDMIQSHLLQIMALAAMEPPATVSAEDVRANKAAVLRATVAHVDQSRRARYTAGKIGRRKVPNYVDEPGVDASRKTETLAEVAFEVKNWR